MVGCLDVKGTVRSIDRLPIGKVCGNLRVIIFYRFLWTFRRGRCRSDLRLFRCRGNRWQILIRSLRPVLVPVIIRIWCFRWLFGIVWFILVIIFNRITLILLILVCIVIIFWRRFRHSCLWGGRYALLRFRRWCHRLHYWFLCRLRRNRRSRCLFWKKLGLFLLLCHFLAVSIILRTCIGKTGSQIPF